MLRHLLGNWLRSTAQARIRDEVVRAARQELNPATQPKPSDPQGDPKAPRSVVGMVFALGIEAGGLVDLIEGDSTQRVPSGVIRQGRLRGRAIVVAESGAGAERAARATEALVAGHRPDWIISAGFAGALTPEVKRHDVVLANSIVAPDGRRLAIDLVANPAALGPTEHVGRIVSVDQIVRRPADKEALGRRHDALAVDLESLAVAEVCQREGVRFSAVRVISDAMDELLPTDVQCLTDQPTTASRLGAAAALLWRRPSSWKDLYALRENALVASDRLAQFLAGLIETL